MRGDPRIREMPIANKGCFIMWVRHIGRVVFTSGVALIALATLAGCSADTIGRGTPSPTPEYFPYGGPKASLWPAPRRSDQQ